MLAFHNKQEVKNLHLARVKENARLDEIHKGEYFNEKGRRFCAVGCTIHGSDHSKYETELGIPLILAGLEDCIFEGLPNDLAKIGPQRS